MFHEAVLLPATFKAIANRHWSNESLHEKFTGEGEDDDVKGHKSKVARPFAVELWGFGIIAGVVGYMRVVGGYGVREEKGAVDRIRWSRIDGIASEEDDYEDERVEPCMPEGDGFPPPEKGLCFPSLRERAEGFRW